MDEEIPFSQENLQELFKSVFGLEGWIFENVRNGESFNKDKEAQIKN